MAKNFLDRFRKATVETVATPDGRRLEVVPASEATRAAWAAFVTFRGYLENVTVSAAARADGCPVFDGWVLNADTMMWQREAKR